MKSKYEVLQTVYPAGGPQAAGEDKCLLPWPAAICGGCFRAGPLLFPAAAESAGQNDHRKPVRRSLLYGCGTRVEMESHAGIDGPVRQVRLSEPEYRA